jgi:GMP synthase-like glutamine amidotransferase
VTRVLVISHEPEAAPGVVGELLAAEGIEVDLHVVLADPASPNTAYPDIANYDAVIAFGSFANAYDELARPWVEPEIRLIADLVAKDVPYLGMCFGGQLLAEALGGHVEKAPEEEQEIGLVSIALDDRKLPVPVGPWFTWHEDRMVLPADIDVLAHNDKAVQLFRHGRAVGTQFHPEADGALVGGWLAIGPDHVPAHTSAERLLDDLEVSREVLRENCKRLVDWFLDDVAGIER